jgi:phenylalanyl-tRNA synthetase beta chain
MIVPLSWLKEYVDITLTPKELGEKLTEVGLGCEKITKTADDTIFELEITPNRPDCLSIIGVAREIAAIETPLARAIKKIKFPVLKTNLKPRTKSLPLIIKTDSKINPRFTGIIISGVKVGKSPKWLKDKLGKMGQKSINNLVDITNYTMLELGNPIHTFDYDKISGHAITVSQTKGGEKFESVDGISYRLPKDAVIITDKEKIIDLCGIKGGKNTGTYEGTKNVLIRVPVEVPILIRRASQTMSLRSDASSIFERGVNTGGTIDTLRRAVDLVLELAGGEIASELYDIKNTDFKPWKLKLRIERLNKILGIEIPTKKVLQILESLNLSPRLVNNIIETTIPTYRNDLKIEEDLIEEVARIYGYNNFPKTMPEGTIPTSQIPYFKDYRLDEKVKNILISAGFSEIYTYSLIGEKDLRPEEINSQDLLRVDNPVSRDFEYLRPTLKINLSKALTENRSNFEKINLFELGKVYLGTNLDDVNEKYFLSGISCSKSYFEVKGLIEKIFDNLGITDDPAKYIEILDKEIFFEINYSQILQNINLSKSFKPLPKYPPIVEDLSIITDEEIKIIDLINEIKRQSSLIVHVSLLDQFKNSKTFHIVYQHRERNLTLDETGKIRKKILENLKGKFNIELKE